MWESINKLRGKELHKRELKIFTEEGGQMQMGEAEEEVERF